MWLQLRSGGQTNRQCGSLGSMQALGSSDPGQQHRQDSHSFPLTKRHLLIQRHYYGVGLSAQRGERGK